MYHTRFVILQLKSSMSNTTPDDATNQSNIPYIGKVENLRGIFEISDDNHIEENVLTFIINSKQLDNVEEAIDWFRKFRFNDCTVVFDKFGIKCNIICQSQSILTTLKLDRNTFEYYECNKEKIIVHVDMNHHLFEQLLNDVAENIILIIYIKNNDIQGDVVSFKDIQCKPRCKECGGSNFDTYIIRDTTPFRSKRGLMATSCPHSDPPTRDPPITLQDIETAVKEGKQVSVMYLPTFGELTITSPIIKTPEDMEAFETDVVGKLLTFRGCRVGNEIKRYVSEDAFNKYFTTSSHNLVIL